MKVAILETEHFEGAFPVIKLFDIPGNEITVYTSPETHKRFVDLFRNEASRYQWAILPARGKFRFFYSLYKKLKKHKPGIFYINTISDNHFLYAFVLRMLKLTRVIMTVHDINCLFQSRSSWNFRQAIIHRGKRWLLNQVNEFNVVADTMMNYLQTKTRQKIHNIPGAVFENRYTPQAIDGSLRIVVPGSLDKRRRDYDQVFELAGLANKAKLNLVIVLLGGYTGQYGKGVIARADAFKSGYCQILFYDTRVVDQDEFDRQMDIAHFVFIPSAINTRICGDIPEVYGITKSSGNIFDVIKHAKPFIVPAALTISPHLQTSCFKYESLNDIIAILISIIHSPAEYKNQEQPALENARNYTIEKVRERNASLFND